MIIIFTGYIFLLMDIFSVYNSSTYKYVQPINLHAKRKRGQISYSHFLTRVLLKNIEIYKLWYIQIFYVGSSSQIFKKRIRVPMRVFHGQLAQSNTRKESQGSCPRSQGDPPWQHSHLLPKTLTAQCAAFTTQELSFTVVQASRYRPSPEIHLFN